PGGSSPRPAARRREAPAFASRLRKRDPLRGIVPPAATGGWHPQAAASPLPAEGRPPSGAQGTDEPVAAPDLRSFQKNPASPAGDRRPARSGAGGPAL